MTFLNSLVAQINFFGAKSVRVYCAGVATGKPRRNIRLWGVQGTAQSKSSEHTHTKKQKKEDYGNVKRFMQQCSTKFVT